MKNLRHDFFATAPFFDILFFMPSLKDTIFSKIDQAISGFHQGQLLKVGEKAPPFKLENQEGVWKDLSQLSDDYLLLWFYPKADTPGCTREACHLRDASSDWKSVPLTIWGVSFDPPTRNKQFKQKYHLPFDLLSDSKREMAIAYGAVKSASAIFPSRLAYLIGKDKQIVHVFPKVNYATFSTEVNEVLKKIL